MPLQNLILDRNSPIPLYHQLASQLEQAIRDGQLAKGEFLTNELELAEQWQVSRPTARRAIQDLVDAGLVVRRRGVGTQVVNDQVRRPVRLSSLFDDLTEAGRQPTTQVLNFEWMKARTNIAETLCVPTGSAVLFIERCRMAGNTKLAILRNWLIGDAVHQLNQTDLQDNGLYPMLRKFGVRPHFATQRVGAIAATATNARILGIHSGAPLVTMRRVMQDHTGRVVEIGEHVYDATHYSVEMTVMEG
jgi:DNA-binding GntR family transcriptional regulator